ncbi:15022_t:CDS:2 [Acaulospora morrowiae]|uniref:15022_t:CDS:1 n=1 Tax=Acaulospora morrowiae TaxID=94023 RepID=A0A9N9A7F9_9GLOM|nr:15022_t:CDS:2 [Acaulospora morrowiae]
MNYQQFQYTPAERQMNSQSPLHLMNTVSGSSKPSKMHLYSLNASQLELTSSPNVSPGPRPTIRPIPSPMTPITPLVLTESHYQKEFVHPSLSNSHDPSEYGYFYHGSNIQHYHQSPLSQLPHRYGYHDQYDYSINHPTQPSTSFSPGSPSPLSSGASTPTYSTCLSSSFPNQLTILNNYCNENSFQPNAVNTVDENLLRNNNTYLAHPSGFVNFDSEDGADMFKDLIITNPLDTGLYYQNFHQKSLYEIMANGTGKCQDNNDTQFHQILKGMNDMDITDFH